MRVGKLLVAWFVVLAGVGNWACGAVIQYPLAELLGDYSYSEPSYVGPNKLIGVDTGLNAWHIRSAKVVLKGTVQSGLIRGDGVKVPAGDVVLKGTFTTQFLAVENGGAAGSPFATEGPFSREDLLYPPFVNPLYEADATLPTPIFKPGIWLSLDVHVAATNLPLRLDLPPQPVLPVIFERMDWWDGYSLISPLTGSITEAYLLVETIEVPEPGTLGVLSLGGLAMLRRVRRS